MIFQLIDVILIATQVSMKVICFECLDLICLRAEHICLYNRSPVPDMVLNTNRSGLLWFLKSSRSACDVTLQNLS